MVNGYWCPAFAKRKRGTVIALENFKPGKKHYLLGISVITGSATMVAGAAAQLVHIGSEPPHSCHFWA
jgi:hypothetical protein